MKWLHKSYSEAAVPYSDYITILISDDANLPFLTQSNVFISQMQDIDRKKIRITDLFDMHTHTDTYLYICNQINTMSA